MLYITSWSDFVIYATHGEMILWSTLWIDFVRFTCLEVILFFLQHSMKWFCSHAAYLDLILFFVQHFVKWFSSFCDTFWNDFFLFATILEIILFFLQKPNSSNWRRVEGVPPCTSCNTKTRPPVTFQCLLVLCLGWQHPFTCFETVSVCSTRISGVGKQFNLRRTGLPENLSILHCDMAFWLELP